MERITSHKDLQDVNRLDKDAYAYKHPLSTKIRHTAWNNIPQPLLEMLQTICEHIISHEYKEARGRKHTINERFCTLQKQVQQAHSEVLLVMAESRQQGLYLMQRQQAYDQMVTEQIVK